MTEGKEGSPFFWNLEQIFLKWGPGTTCPRMTWVTGSKWRLLAPSRLMEADFLRCSPRIWTKKHLRWFFCTLKSENSCFKTFIGFWNSACLGSGQPYVRLNLLKMGTRALQALKPICPISQGASPPRCLNSSFPTAEKSQCFILHLGPITCLDFHLFLLFSWQLAMHPHPSQQPSPASELLNPQTAVLLPIDGSNSLATLCYCVTQKIIFALKYKERGG